MAVGIVRASVHGVNNKLPRAIRFKDSGYDEIPIWVPQRELRGVGMHRKNLLTLAMLVIACSAELAHAQSYTPLGATQVRESASIGSRDCDPCRSQVSNSPGGVIVSGYGAFGQATANLGTMPVVMANATSAGATIETSASVTYSFEIEPNGQPGAPATPPDGIPISIIGNAGYTATFEYSSDPFGWESSVYSSIQVTQPWGTFQTGIGYGCPSGTVCPFTTGDYDQPVNTPENVSIEVDCYLFEAGSCYAIMDPTITIAPAYAPYYKVVFNQDLTSQSSGSTGPLQFIPSTPCRLVDTRKSGGPIQGGASRNFPVPQQGGCNIPTSAVAYSVNLTVVPPGPLGYVTIWPTGEAQPVASLENSLDGRTKANAAIVPAGYQGAVSIFASNTTDVVLDIDDYFAPVGNTTLAFYPLKPCRVADTRNPLGGLGGPYLRGGVARQFPILEASSCNIPSSAQAYSLNFTAVPHAPLGYLTVWPFGQKQPVVSTLNSVTGTVVANAAIVPAGTDNEGSIVAFASNDSDLVIDINGYFAPPGQNGLSLYTVTPCRVLDTRNGNGAYVGELMPPVDVVDSVCGPSTSAQAYVLNATVVPSGPLGYLTLWPDSNPPQPPPVVSTLNALDGAITSNMAIVPNSDGSTDAFASNLTQLILDISAYFAP